MRAWFLLRGFAIRHLPFGKRRLRWVAQKLGYGDLNFLGSCAVRLPFVA
jgi:hypothetical protein